MSGEIVRPGEGRPRVWFDDEDIPYGVAVLDQAGDIHVQEEDDSFEPRRMIGFGPLVEVRLPNYGAAVRLEREHRAAHGGVA